MDETIYIRDYQHLKTASTPLAWQTNQTPSAATLLLNSKRPQSSQLRNLNTRNLDLNQVVPMPMTKQSVKI